MKEILKYIYEFCLIFGGMYSLYNIFFPVKSSLSFVLNLITPEFINCEETKNNSEVKFLKQMIGNSIVNINHIFIIQLVIILSMIIYGIFDFNYSLITSIISFIVIIVGSNIVNCNKMKYMIAEKENRDVDGFAKSVKDFGFYYVIFNVIFVVSVIILILKM